MRKLQPLAYITAIEPLDENRTFFLFHLWIKVES